MAYSSIVRRAAGGGATTLSSITLFLLFLTSTIASAQRADSARSQRPVFIENKGQWDPQAKFLLRSRGLDMWVTDQGVRYDMYRMKENDSMAVGGNRLLSDRKSVV